MKKLFTTSFVLLGLMVFGQFTTPNTNQTYTIEQLDALTDVISYDSALGKYILTEDLIISETDTFLAQSDFVLAIEEGKLITVAGVISIDAPNEVHFTSTAPSNTYFRGISLSSSSVASFNKFKMTYGGGIRALSPNFTMNNSEVSFQNAGISTGAAINFSGGSPIVQNSIFKFNETPAVTSAANSDVSLSFIGNILEANNLANSNRPQINMGPTGANGLTTIKNNSIVGDRTKTRVGGISVSSLLSGQSNVLIENNLIRDNRYGITITAARATGNIINNQILNNDTEPNPNNGGSGINITSGTANTNEYMINIYENTIMGNLWGITKIGTSVNIHLGDQNVYGLNVFDNNGNGGATYALYNNSSTPISAQGNCWDNWLTEERVEEVIFHYNDDQSLGLVDYSNFVCLLNTSDVNSNQIKIYPNPSNGTFKVKITQDTFYQITDFTGKLIQSGNFKKGVNELNVQLNRGTYILRTNLITKKIIIK